MALRGRRRAAVAEPVDVLMVCTGNICRSPLAEHLLAARAPGLRVSSAGLAALPGAPMHPLSAQALAEHGVQARPHVARQLGSQHVEAAGLVLTATREHRRDVIALLPEAADRVFTMRELARLLRDEAAGGSLAAVLEQATQALRIGREPQDLRGDDLGDPLGQPYAEFARCADLIESALAPLVGVRR